MLRRRDCHAKSWAVFFVTGLSFCMLTTSFFFDQAQEAFKHIHPASIAVWTGNSLPTAAPVTEEIRQVPVLLPSCAGPSFGSTNQNVLPLPTSLSTPMEPPWASTANLQNVSPSPVECFC